MPFTFKLSKRLALSKTAVALPAALLAACEKPLRLTSPTPPGPVVQVVTSPDSVTLDPYQAQQFVAYGRTQAGGSVAVAVRWSTSGGTITSSGLYTADSIVGSYQVTATAQVAATAPAAATATNTTISGSSSVKNRGPLTQRSEEHTSELQSRLHLVCRLLLEKKKKKNTTRVSRDY